MSICFFCTFRKGKERKKRREMKKKEDPEGKKEIEKSKRQKERRRKQTHLVPLCHHPRVRRPNPPGPDDPHRLVLQQAPHEQGGKPPLVLPPPHEDVGLRDAARRR
jgi:hypothetical protein